jgi:plasmid replication initiation protein
MFMSDSQFVVVKHNCIVEAGYTLTTYEQRILLTCIAQIDSTKPITANDEFEVSVLDIADLVKVETHAVYDYLNEAVKRLAERWLIIETPTDIDKQLRTRWISAITYRKKRGVIKLTFAKHILPYLSDLSREFTQYKLSNVSNFKSSYSFRLYEFLKRWVNIGEKQFSVEWIREKLEIQNKYPRMDNFKKDVIDVAVKEINEHSDMTVAYEPVKKGRNIIAFKFTYTITKPQKKTTVQQQQHSLFLNPLDVIKKSTSKTETTKKQFTSSSSTEYGPKGEFLWGLKRADVERNAKVGEGYEQAAKRIVEERKKANSNAV